MSTWAKAQVSRQFGPALLLLFQAEDAFLPVRAALNVETCQFQSSTTPAVLPTSEMAWENRVIMVGHNDPPYLIRHQAGYLSRCHSRDLFYSRLRWALFILYLGIMSSRRVYRHVS